MSTEGSLSSALREHLDEMSTYYETSLVQSMPTDSFLQSDAFPLLQKYVLPSYAFRAIRARCNGRPELVFDCTTKQFALCASMIAMRCAIDAVVDSSDEWMQSIMNLQADREAAGRPQETVEKTMENIKRLCMVIVFMKDNAMDLFKKAHPTVSAFDDSEFMLVYRSIKTGFAAYNADDDVFNFYRETTIRTSELVRKLSEKMVKNAVCLHPLCIADVGRTLRASELGDRPAFRGNKTAAGFAYSALANLLSTADLTRRATTALANSKKIDLRDGSEVVFSIDVAASLVRGTKLESEDYGPAVLETANAFRAIVDELESRSDPLILQIDTQLVSTAIYKFSDGEIARLSAKLVEAVGYDPRELAVGNVVTVGEIRGERPWTVLDRAWKTITEYVDVNLIDSDRAALGERVSEDIDWWVRSDTYDPKTSVANATRFETLMGVKRAVRELEPAVFSAGTMMRLIGTEPAAGFGKIAIVGGSSAKAFEESVPFPPYKDAEYSKRFSEMLGNLVRQHPSDPAILKFETEVGASLVAHTEVTDIDRFASLARLAKTFSADADKTNFYRMRNEYPPFLVAEYDGLVRYLDGVKSTDAFVLVQRARFVNIANKEIDEVNQLTRANESTTNFCLHTANIFVTALTTRLNFVAARQRMGFVVFPDRTDDDAEIAKLSPEKRAEIIGALRPVLNSRSGSDVENDLLVKYAGRR